jgi:hypothetical protein
MGRTIPTFRIVLEIERRGLINPLPRISGVN